MTTPVDLLRFFGSRPIPGLLEGLPHPLFEAQLFGKEVQRSQDVIEIHESWFYRKPIVADPELLRRVLELVRDPESFLPKQPDTFRPCGGFHADYAVEWVEAGIPRQALLCFGCAEAKIFTPLTSDHCDLIGPAERQLWALLQGVRQLRPLSAGA